MKEIRPKEDKAVSPIIATILLIAITVVLAATLVTREGLRMEREIQLRQQVSPLH